VILTYEVKVDVLTLVTVTVAGAGPGGGLVGGSGRGMVVVSAGPFLSAGGASVGAVLGSFFLPGVGNSTFGGMRSERSSRTAALRATSCSEGMSGEMLGESESTMARRWNRIFEGCAVRVFGRLKYWYLCLEGIRMRMRVSGLRYESPYWRLSCIERSVWADATKAGVGQCYWSFHLLLGFQNW